MPDVTTPHGEQVLPNRRGLILLLGIAAWLVGIIGLIALGKGLDHLGKIKEGKMDGIGKGTIVFGMILGVAGLVVNLSLLIHQCARS